MMLQEPIGRKPEYKNHDKQHNRAHHLIFNKVPQSFVYGHDVVEIPKISAVNISRDLYSVIICVLY